MKERSSIASIGLIMDKKYFRIMAVAFLVVMFMCSKKHGTLATQECGSVVNNTLISPGYPNNYPPNMDCNYSVPIPQDMAVKVAFHEFDVEYHPSCDYDYLTITNENGETFGVICGFRYGTDIIVTGHYALLTFHSDYETQDRGFNISFTVVPKPEIIGCGSVVNNTLTSPGYPNNYPPNMDCNYSVPIPHRMALKITFHEFDVEYDLECKYDYLKVINENDEIFGAICGEQRGENVIVIGNYVQLIFHSDSEVQKKGFLISFTSVPTSEIRKCGFVVNNTLKSPGYPGNYPSDMDCDYSVPIPRGMAIKILFHEMMMEKHSSCKYDYLKITNDKNKTLGVFCGSRRWTFIIVTGNSARLTFHSDSACSGKGYFISFTVVPKPDIMECGFVKNNTLTSPGYPDNYPSNMDCNYSVPIPRDMALKITFHEFNLEFQSQCRYDYLNITNENRKQFGLICGDRRGMVVNVTGNYVLLKFHSDADVRRKGFLLFFTALPLPNITECGSIVNNTLTSPGYPNNYPSNMDCNYSLLIPHGMAMKITFHEFHMEYDSSCRFDYLDITNERDKPFGRLCGGPKRKDATVDVTGKYVRLQFHSDADLQKRGFLLYFSTSPLPKIKECGSIVNNILTSPGYPNNYPSNMDCAYLLPIPHGMAVIITFREFHMEYSSRCRNDYLSIANEGFKLFGIHCGGPKKKNGTVDVTGNYVQIIFRSDADLQRRGFLLHFSTVPLPNITECGSIENNTLTSPGYPNNYPSNVDCYYSLPIPRGMAMKITFHDFHLEYDSSCSFDYLDIANDKRKLFDKYCGGPSRTLATIEVTGSYIRLQFHSDSDIQKKGFLLYFSTFPLPKCGSVVNNTLTSPGYPNKYPNNLECKYYVPIQPGMAVIFKFDDFDVDFDCENDYLEISNGNGNALGVFCGSKSGTEVLAAGHFALLEFYTDHTTQARGFMISFTFVSDCGPWCSFQFDGTRSAAVKHAYYKLACQNVISILDVIKCFPRIVPALEVSSSNLSILPAGVFSNLTDLQHL